jgi:3-hydroxyacyl-CoA dehydrogenase
MSTFTLPKHEGRPVCVLGGGVLGRRIACAWAAGGYDCNIRDPSAEQRTSAIHFFDTSISTFLSLGQTSYKTVRAFEDIESAIKDAWLIIECAPEKLQIKIDTLAELESKASKDAIIVTNSSSYKSREMLEKVGTGTAVRVANMHWMMPRKIQLFSSKLECSHDAARVRIVELMTDGQSDEAIFPFLSDRLREIGYHPIVARKESTGFVINRMWAAIKREALMILSEGVSVPEELDAVWVEMFGNNQNGPCMMMDGVGLDTVSLIEQHYVKERGLSPKGTVEYVQKFIDEGRVGAKSGKGGLYPPGYTTKTKGEAFGSHDDLHAPTLYFLDIGIENAPKDVFDSGRILVGSPDGRSLKSILDKQRLPDGITISVPLGKMFWTSMGVPDKNDGCIFSAKLDGSNIEEIIPKGKVHTPKQICLDHVNNKLYFCDREGLRVMRCNTDGSAYEILIQNGNWENEAETNNQLNWCVGVAVSPSTGHFYWTQKGYSKGKQGKILRANIDIPKGQDASNRKDIEVLFQQLPEPIDLEIDDEEQVLYWSDRGDPPIGNSLNRAAFSSLKAQSGDSHSLPGRDYELLARNLHEAIGLALDTKNKHIYTTDLGGTVYRFDHDGSNKKKFYDGEGAFAGIALAFL